MTLSILIVNWNSWNYLVDCINSIISSLVNIHDYEILIIDNNSKDDKSNSITKISNKITFYKSNENLGFPKANNILIEKAKGKYIALVNPDVIINEKKTFESCIDVLESNHDIGIIGTKVIDGTGKIVKFCARKYLNPWNFIAANWYLSSFFSKIHFLESKCSIYYKSYNESKIVDAIHGGFMIIKKEVIETIGLLDERLKMYLEDMEYSLRAKRYGIKTYYLADKTIIHFTNKSSEKAPKLWIRKLGIQANLEFLKLRYSSNYLVVYSFIFIIVFVALYPMYLLFTPIIYFIKREKKFLHLSYLKIFDIIFLIRFINKIKHNE